MIKGHLIFLILLVGISSVHLLPRKDFLRPNTPENIERLKHLGPDDLAEELSGQFEGDIVISPEELKELLGGRAGKTGLIDERYRWTNNVVPYQIREADFTTAQINYITLGVQKIMDTTCIKLVPYNPNVHTNYVFITGENSGCWSYVGMIGGAQQMNLQPYDLEVGCFRLYTIVHEFIHALGFFHMQSATERDEFVEIIWENIQQGTQNNFAIYNSSVISQYGVEYDYGSVMHYSSTAFSINGQPTIVPLRDLGGQVMGQRVRMSEKDIARLNGKYCPYVPDRRPIPNLSELFRRINNGMSNLFQAIFG